MSVLCTADDDFFIMYSRDINLFLVVERAPSLSLNERYIAARSKKKTLTSM